MTLLSEPAAVAGVVSAIGGGLTAALTFIATRRKYSGTVDTTQASELWDELRSYRRDLTEQISRMRKEHDEELAKLKLALHEKDEAIAQRDHAIQRLTERVSELEMELERVKARERKVAETLAEKEAS